MDAEISNGLEVIGNHHGSENGIYAHRSIKSEENIRGKDFEFNIPNSYSAEGVGSCDDKSLHNHLVAI